MRAAAASPEGQRVVSQQVLQNFEQMLVNEALVARIFQCEETESALRTSVTRNDKLLARQRTARAMVDSLGDDLRALRADIARLHARTPLFHARLHGQVDAALGKLDRAIDSARQAGAGLPHLPSPKLVQGLGAAIESELALFQQASGLPCQRALDPLLRELILPNEPAQALYRALRECLNNVVRHSLASRVSILLEILDDKVLLNVSDNGIGVDDRQPARPGARGLSAVGQRLSALGGALVVASSRPHGTSVTLTLPLV